RRVSAGRVSRGRRPCLRRSVRLRWLWVLQESRGGVRTHHLPDRLAQGALSGPLPRRVPICAASRVLPTACGVGGGQTPAHSSAASSRQLQRRSFLGRTHWSPWP